MLRVLLFPERSNFPISAILSDGVQATASIPPILYVFTVVLTPQCNLFSGNYSNFFISSVLLRISGFRSRPLEVRPGGPLPETIFLAPLSVFGPLPRVVVSLSSDNP